MQLHKYLLNTLIFNDKIMVGKALLTTVIVFKTDIEEYKSFAYLLKTK